MSGKFQIYVISSGRAKNVGKMRQLLGNLSAIWVVREGEEADYKAAGAQAVYGCPGGLMGARNWAIEHAKEDGVYCVQISDDLIKLKQLCRDKTVVSVDVQQAVNLITSAMEKNLAFFGGLAPTDNVFFASQEIKLKNFVVGDFIVINPETECRFDTQLKLKEDYDFTCQNLKRYGKAIRVDYLLATFVHRSNKGGAVDYRTAELEQETILYLKQKWGDIIRDNPRRENEILLKWK